MKYETSKKGWYTERYEKAISSEKKCNIKLLIFHLILITGLKCGVCAESNEMM